jgi:hypothetical protein
MGRLKSCPFCGGKAEIKDCGDDIYKIECENDCIAGNNHFLRKDINALIKAWNKRVNSWIPFTEVYDEEEDCMMFTCTLPDDGEEIMATDGKYVWEDIFIRDGYDCYLDSGFEFITRVTAWMPKPLPFKKEVM